MRGAAGLALLLAPIVSCSPGFSCAPLHREASPPRVEDAPSPGPTPEAPADLVEVPPDLRPDLRDDLAAASLVEAIDRSLEGLATRSDDAPVSLGDASCPTGSVRRSLRTVREALAGEGRIDPRLFERFRMFRSTGRPGGALVTGYYEPVLEGRTSREGKFVHPIYRRPDDLIEVRLDDFLTAAPAARIFGRVSEGRLVPYPSRREIDAEGALEGRGLELLWLADPIDRFFLHVQGSGVVRLEDGTRRRVGFAASNGRSYTSIGRVLGDEGSLAPGEATAPGIQAYLRAHPERRDEILYRNERYIFFREVGDGPVGSLGVKLTPGRSIAADSGLYPPGMLGYLVTRTPVVAADGGAGEFRDVARFVLAQDSGAAITGPGRVDLFFGTGPQAGLEAGHMSERGELYFLLPPC